ncbi:MAG: radical SAM protein [SAR202 cluster bacterium]|nr:radical SAM protein [SAR202 cluster bacterium]
MSKKVLFVVYDNGSYDHAFPMGIGAITSILKRDGHDFTMWNQDMHHWPDDYLRTYLDENKFDVVILSLIAGYYQYQKMKSLSKAINNSKNRPFYIMGGYGPTPEPEFFIKKSGCDVVCMGEGEVTISKLMEALENKKPLSNVPGIAWLENGKLKQTPRAPLVHDLDNLPPIPYEKFAMHYYRMMRLPNVKATEFSFPLMSARGCTFKCTFCYRMDPGYRVRTPGPLLDEIERLYKDYGITYIGFQDDLLMSSVEHTEAVCLEFIKRDLPVRWMCNGRLNYCSEELLQLMKDAGCDFINYGIESMDQIVLNNMKKGLRPEMIIRGIENTLKVGINPGLNFIFGNKGDNKETIKSAVDFLLKYDDCAQKRTIRPVTPYPGSPLYYDAIKMGLLDKDNPAEDFYERKHLNSDLICCNFTELNDEEFYECLRWANRTLMKNYFEKQKTAILSQIDYLYNEQDASFRGFRHSAGDGQVGTRLSTKSKAIALEGKEIMTGLVNWESSQTGDAERFSQQLTTDKGNKKLKQFDEYLKKKAIRTAVKKTAKKTAKKEAVNLRVTS